MLDISKPRLYPDFIAFRWADMETGRLVRWENPIKGTDSCQLGTATRSQSALLVEHQARFPRDSSSTYQQEQRIDLVAAYSSDSFEYGRLASSILARQECYPSEARDQEVFYPSKSLDVQVGEMEVGIDWSWCGHGTVDLVFRLSHRV